MRYIQDDAMNLNGVILSGFLLIAVANSFPQVSDTSSLVTSTTTTTTPSPPPSPDANEDPKEHDAPVIPKIYEMRVDANVSNRFARCQVTSKVKNLDKTPHEATFSVIIPEKAYISGFIMEIDGKQYEAYVQEKERAKDTYKNAVQSGQAAAHVAVSARDSNRFTVSVNVEPQKKAVFYLKYEELLERQNGKYELVINIHPGQPVKQLDVQVNIDESSPLKFVRAPALRSGNEINKKNDKLNPNADIVKTNKTSAVVKFNPDIEQQKQFAAGLGTEEDNGLAGQFVVEYDVERDPRNGEVLVDGDYFVHFFSPSDLPALPKQVVFILDTSGSMEGIRISQLKEAMKSILPQLKPEDIFSLVEFGSVVKVWNIPDVAVQYQSGIDTWGYPGEEEANRNLTQQPLPPPFPATEDNLNKADKVVDKLKAFGGTDIDSALKTGLQIVQKNLEDTKHQPIIIFLTDGEATVGMTNNEKIIKTVTELNTGKTPIFSLSFGDGADREFLQKVSLKNQGVARHIYEAADASLQLQEFYKQISSPLLSNVTFKYISHVKEVTRTAFPILFYGSELVVAGKLDDEAFKPPVAEGWGVNGTVKVTPAVQQSVGNLERLWAYLTLKQILEKRDAADNKTGLTQEALAIAMKYSFVSDVTSLVVVKPNQTDAVDTEDGSQNDKRYPIYAQGRPLSVATIKAGSPYLMSAAASGFHAKPIAFQSNNFATVGGAGGFSGPVLESDEYDYSDRIYNGMPLTTPYPPGPPLSTTHTPPLEPQVVKSALELLKEKLPWLAAALGEDESINLKAGKFKLGLNETISAQPECPKSVSDAPGTCTLINKCPQVFTQLTDLQVYEKYFCDLQGFAGVCCPK
ncbi:unnamed protein product [Phyllotreta striolata]|uniref:Inter-alpha-trypsin inhibitor heavy chain H4-like n=1 Tax=Phyllotreta striolata TaxID=444603 RepID=A0A9N9XQB4_PHYSR|nr:unnamed protein product [Phyllotreta striolata]